MFAKRFLALAILAPAFALLASCAGKAIGTDADFERILSTVEKKANAVSRFRVDFVKTRSSSVFNRALTVEARLIFEKPSSFRLVTSGDVNVEVVSDGKVIVLRHDQKDEEVYDIEGGRDRTVFADPMMLLINGLANGALRRYSILNQATDDDFVTIEVGAAAAGNVERTEKAILSFSKSGELRKARLVFRNGDEDEFAFRSWSMPARNDPELLELKRKLEMLPRQNLSTSPRSPYQTLRASSIHGLSGPSPPENTAEN
jgi:outer membrane lipoprotein-sorting protein